MREAHLPVLLAVVLMLGVAGCGPEGGIAADAGIDSAAAADADMPDCELASDCPGTDTECKTRSCTDGMCGFTFAAAGTMTTDQVAGDCLQHQCDGAGAIVGVADDTDPFVDTNPCTTDGCAAGTPTNPPTAPGSACTSGDGSVCDGAGACVECVTEVDCPEPAVDAECLVRSCTGGTCGFGYKPAGIVTTDQTPGDCLRNECDGAGEIVPVPYDADPFVDGNQCTNDICMEGTPVNPAKTIGSACASGDATMCDGAGTCVQCLTLADCPAPSPDAECLARSCTVGTCGFTPKSVGTAAQSQTAGDCLHNECDGNGEIVGVPDATDPFVDGNECTSDTCLGSAPTNPPVAAGTECAGGTCDENGMCLGAPTVTAASYPVIAHGGTLVLTGTAFTGASAVTIGDVAQMFVVDSDTQITITSVSDATPLAAQNLVVTVGAESSTPFVLTVIRLQVSELDSDTVSIDALEFVEISTGVPAVNLSGYALVFWNGSTDQCYLALNLAATTDANGLLVIGNPGVVPGPALTFANNTLQNGQDAVGLYQAATTAFVCSGASPTVVNATNLIDALVYDTADVDDPGLLDTLLGVGSPERIQLDEGSSPTSETQSIQRCGDGRRDGRKFTTGTPATPGAVNAVAACP